MALKFLCRCCRCVAFIFQCETLKLLKLSHSIYGFHAVYEVSPKVSKFQSVTASQRHVVSFTKLLLFLHSHKVLFSPFVSVVCICPYFVVLLHRYSASVHIQKAWTISCPCLEVLGKPGKYKQETSTPHADACSSVLHLPRF